MPIYTENEMSGAVIWSDEGTLYKMEEKMEITIKTEDLIPYSI